MGMDAVKFVRERNRMCHTFDASCDGCPAFEDGCCDNARWDEKIVPIVEAWARNHPPKTRQSEFLKMFSDASLGDDGALRIAPCDVDPKNFGLRICNEAGRACNKRRREFWSQEVE